MNLYSSNRIENLVDDLISILKKNNKSCFDKEIIIVQSFGMARWLSIQIAERIGICANFSFLFPNSFIDRITGSEPADTLLFTPEILTFRIMSILPGLIELPEFGGIKAYFGAEAEIDFTLPEQKIKLYGLSENIADILDQYLLYRPDLIFDWEQGKDKNWQAVLWRSLTAYNKRHRAYTGKKIIERTYFDPNLIPKKISIFGVITLPPFYFEIIYTLSAFCETNIFILNPSYKYWGSILSDKEISKAEKKYIKKGITPDSGDIHIEHGNSLLASMGTSCKEFIDLIIEHERINEIDSFYEQREDTMLASIQSDIFNLIDRGIDTEKKIVPKNDTSIRIHSCHSPMREVEVLYDNLLYMFEEDPTLKPSDIIVMTPDIDSYSPYISAVFDISDKNSKKIPFSLADRNPTSTSELIQTFFLILDLSKSRYKPTSIFAIVSSNPIKEKFKLTDNQIEHLYTIVKKTKIKWGIDGRHKSKHFNMPDFDENTWQAGFDRLILGYAIDRNDRPFYKTAPYSINGDTAIAAGNFFDFFDRAASLSDILSGDYTLDVWSNILKEIIDDFFEITEANHNEVNLIFKAAASLNTVKKTAEYDENIGIETVKAYLYKKLSDKEALRGFSTGEVIFCSALPMRSIPFKVICFIGLNEDAFPRRDKELGFDLIAAKPRPCDRSKRNEDKYLFLEAIISARKKLYISFVGQDICNNRTLLSSPLVSELTDYIERGFSLSDNSDIKEHIIIKHRLQAFCSAYFKANNRDRLFTYAKIRFETAKAYFRNKKFEKFIAEELPPIELLDNIINLEELKKFFSNPSKYFSNKRLSVFLPNYSDIIKESENFEISGLDKYELRNYIIKKRLAHEEEEELYDLIKASGSLPHGSLGESFYADLLFDTDRFLKIIEKIIGKEDRGTIDIKTEFEEITLFARITSVYGNNIIEYRYGKIRPIDKLQAWLSHLIIKTGKPDSYYNIKLIGLNPYNMEKIEVFGFEENLSKESAYEILFGIIRLFFEGNIAPLIFFPDTSYAYAKALIQKGLSDQKALSYAQKKWRGIPLAKNISPNESDDPYYGLCFDDENPIDNRFQKTALKVFEPLITNIRQEK